MEDYSQLTPPSQIADILRQLQEAGIGNEAQLAELVRQGMTRGLGVSQDRITPELGFTGGPGAVAGYAGALRPSDRPDGGNPNWRPSDVINMTGMKQPQYNAAVEQQAIESQVVGGRRFGDVMDMLGASKGLDKEVQQGMANRILPGLVPQEVVDPGAKPLPANADLSKWYDKDTGEPAGVENITSQRQLREKYMRLNTGQLADAQNLPQLMELAHSYRRLEKKLPLPEKGVINRALGYANIKGLRMQGDGDIGDIDSINARITSLATAFGGDKRVSDKEMALLKGAVINDSDTAPMVASKLKNLDNFMAIRVKSSGLPWLRKQMEQPAPEPQPAQGATQSDRVKVVGPDGRKGSLPASQLQDALNNGYKQVQ